MTGRAPWPHPSARQRRTGIPLAQALLRRRDRGQGVAGRGLRHRADRQMGAGRRGRGRMGLPRKQGFDYFFGYLSQVHAHNHFPDYLWRNEERIAAAQQGHARGRPRRRLRHRGVPVRRRPVHRRRAQVRRQPPGPAVLSVLEPDHSAREQRAHPRAADGAHVPDYGPYALEDWPDPTRARRP
jgi:hypothetical protein